MTRASSSVFTVLALLAAAPMASAQSNNPCDQPGEEPDVIVGSISGKTRYGAIGGITAFAVGTTSCNIGTCWLNWLDGTPNHPVIGQSMFRLKDGRFEQIGQSWLKHGFAALNGSVCSPNCIPADGQHLGVNCSDPYGSGLNGDQSRLGPKYEVNVANGTHLHPYTTQGQTGNAIYKRLQVHDADLDPLLNPGALYYVEAQYVTADDTAAGNGFNNNAYRQALVSAGGGTFDFTLTGATIQQQAAIRAWRANDPAVTVQELNGQYVAAHNVTHLGGGLWHYEYALQNVISREGAQAFRLPIPHGIQLANVGFHDVDYHSGEPYGGTDWAATIDTSSSPHALVWSTQTFSQNPNANALRWGTLYNFRFDATWPPAAQTASIVPFLSGGMTLLWATEAPDRCGDDFCDTDESETSCAYDCGFLGVAGEVPGAAPLTIELQPDRDLLLSWSESCFIGDPDYAVYEGTIGDFASHGARLCSTEGATSVIFTPSEGDTYYLIVPNNGSREGSYGRASNGSERPQGHPACMSQSIVSCN